MRKKKTKEIILDDNNSVLVEQKTIADKPNKRIKAKRIVKGEQITEQAYQLRKNRAKKLLIDGNLSIQGIAQAVKLDMRDVSNVLKTDLNMTLEDLEHFKAHKVEYLELAQGLLLRSALSKENLNNINTKDAIKSFESLNKLNRLATGQSTSNVSVHGFIANKLK
jgi:hypothetical protein